MAELGNLSLDGFDLGAALGIAPEAEAAKKRAASGRIWKIVIAVLVIAIFAVGIGTTLAGNKGKKRQE